METTYSNSKTFWSNDPYILFSFPLILHVVPLPSKNYIYNLNALTRLLIILSIISLLFGNLFLCLVFICSIILCIFVYKYFENKSSESFLNIDDNIDIDNSVNEKLIREYTEKNENYINESDEYNKKYKFYNDKDNIYKTPTYDNVYNIPVEKQFNNLDKLEPPKEIKEQEYLNNVDAYSFINNERFNIPRIERDQMKFANWLYKGLPNCKTDQYQCIKGENLNLKSKII